jgi:hypothetical protein
VDGQQDAIVAGGDIAQRIAPGWWRRNRWGLIGLVPALVVALAIPVHDAYGTFWKSQPRDPISVSKGSWVSFDGGSLRLETFAPATETLPDGAAAWRATIDFRATSETALLGCQILMQDSAGSTYDANPVVLTDLGLDVGPATCSSDTGNTTSWHSTIYFMAPRGTDPTAIRVVVSSALPEYVRLGL